MRASSPLGTACKRCGKLALPEKKQQKKLVDGLAGRFAECVTERNCTLIRYDISQSLRNLYDAVKDETV